MIGKTTPQQEREEILADFAEEYAGLPLEQWAVGFVATVMNVDARLPKFGEGSDRSFMTKLLVGKFQEVLAQREAEILKRIQELPWSPSVVHPEWRDEVISLLTPSE